MRPIGAQSGRTYLRYTSRAREPVDKYKPGLPIFHNSGHIRHGDRELARRNTVPRLESHRIIEIADS
jgi:hypothetical protein